MSTPSELLPQLTVTAKSTAPQSGVETVQYLRAFSCVVADKSGNGLDFADFRCTFQIRRGDSQTPNSCDLRIYNLSDDTAHQIAQKEFTNISISAGYESNNGLIFRGTIKQFRKGRVDALDSYVDISAADSDEAYNFAPISTSLVAGSKPGTAAQALLTAMQRVGTATAGQPAITQGYAPDWPQNGTVRGRVYFGLARDECRDFAKQNVCSWSIQDGALTFIPLRSYIPGTVPLISSNSGLLGTPEQTPIGVKLSVLLNPNIKLGQCIKLDATVNQLRYGLSSAKEILASNIFLNQKVLNTPNPSGLFYVMNVSHKGDTRGNDWYSELTCLAVDATIPSTEAQAALTTVSAGSIPLYP